MTMTMTADATTTPMNSWGEICWKAEQRRVAAGFQVRAMIEARDAYNGLEVVPMPSVSGDPTMAMLVPALVGDTIDQMAMKACSTGRPQLMVPAVDDTDPTSREAARNMRRALYATWHDAALVEVLLRSYYRYWTAYGLGSINVMPDFARGRARLESRDPLGIFPDYRHPNDVDLPLNVASIYGRSVEWLRRAFGADFDFLTKGARASDVWDVIEWVDEEAIVIGVMGPRFRSQYNAGLPNWPIGGYEVKRWVNQAGLVAMAILGRVTLDRIQGQVHNIIPIVREMGKLTALDVIAAERSIFQDLVITGRDGKTPRLISGPTWHDGRTGEPNIIMDGEAKLLTGSSGPVTHPVLDRLERSARITGGNPALNSGELNGSLRSGQTVSAIAGLSVDPRVQEANEVAQRVLELTNKGIMAVERGYFGARKIVAFSGWPTDKGTVEYRPSELYPKGHDHNVVTYSFPGSDVNHISIAVTQVVAAELMSRETARRKHPFIDDPDHEERAIITERLADAILGGFLKQSMDGTLPFTDTARVYDLYQHGAQLVDAINTAQREAQERQAAQAPPPGEGQGAPPETMPGMAQPGAGAESQAAPPPTVPPVPPSLQNFKTILTSLRAQAGTTTEPAPA